MADENKIAAPEPQEVVAQEAKQVGDEVAGPREVAPEVNTESVPAQVAQPRESDPKTVPVHETVVATDEVITDPSDPRAVQVPDAGRGDASVPIHGLGNPTPEQVFAEEAAGESKDEAPQPEPQREAPAPQPEPQREAPQPAPERE